MKLKTIQTLSILSLMIGINQLHATDLYFKLASGFNNNNTASSTNITEDISGLKSLDNKYGSSNYAPSIRTSLGMSWDIKRINLGFNLHYAYNLMSATNEFKEGAAGSANPAIYKVKTNLNNIIGLSFTPAYWLTNNVLINTNLGFNMAQLTQTVASHCNQPAASPCNQPAASPISLPGGFSAWDEGFELGMGMTSYFSQHIALSADYIFSYYLPVKKYAAGFGIVGGNQVSNTDSKMSGTFQPTTNTVLFGISYHFESYHQHHEELGY